MFCSVRDLCEELGVIDAQSSKLVRFEDGHIDAMFLEGVVQVLYLHPPYIKYRFLSQTIRGAHRGTRRTSVDVYSDNHYCPL